MELSDIVQNIHDLPTLPSVAVTINEEVRKDNLTALSLAEIVSNDPSLAARVLRLANSAYYGLSRKIDTLDRAITVLGFTTIKNLALTISIFKVFKENGHESFNIESLWQHCLGCAVASKSIVSNSNPGLSEQAFLSGIIHDIGKIAIAQAFPDKMAEIMQAIKNSETPQSDIEKDILGFTHQQIGSLLSEKWNFPHSYCKAIRLHHTPYSIEPSIDINKNESILISSVYVGNQIAKAMSFGASTDPKSIKIDRETWDRLDIERDKISGFREQIKEDYEIIKKVWELD